MASDYGLNFGWRRSDETLRVSEGRFRTPVTGSSLLMGTAVQIDPANAGYLKVAPTNAVAKTGFCGLLLQEENFLGSIYEISGFDSFGAPYGVAKKNRLSVITNGPGCKVWFKNTTGQTRADGRVINGISIVDFTGIALGDELGWSGTQWAKVTGALTNAHMTVTALNTTTQYLEAVLSK